MFIKQLSIFVENKNGRLETIIDTLSKSGINISALSIADTTDFGILRMIVDDPDKARNALRDIGVISKCTDVIAVYIDDKTGGLAEVLKVLSEEELGIEYYGPINGHDLNELELYLNLAKRSSGPVLIHVIPEKGKGYKYAEEDT